MSKSTSSQTDASLERESTGDHRRPILWSAFTGVVVTVVIYFLALYAGGLLLSLYAGARHWSASYADNWINNSVVAQFLYVLIDEAITVGLLWAFIRFRKYKGVIKALGLTKPKVKDFRYVIGGILTYYLIYVLSINLITSITHLNTNQQQNVGFQVVTGGGGLFLTFLSLVILPPLVEETIFRGFLFNGFRRHVRFVSAALFTSVLFAIPHLFESNGGGLLWTAGIDTFTLSLVLCYVREKTGHVWAGMAIHGLKNFLAFYVLFMHH